MTTKRDDRDIICEQDYTPLSNAELAAHIETYARLMHNTPLSDGAWLDDITGPARVLLARAEAAEVLAYERLEAALFAEQRATDAELRAEEAAAEAQTAEEELEAERETTDETNGFIDSLIAALDHPIRGDEVFLSEIVETATALKARVAELEAAQQWRPVTEAPPAPGRYMVVSRTGDITTDLYLFGRWQVLDTYIMHWRPIPPLPPAPNVQEPTP